MRKSEKESSNNRFFISVNLVFLKVSNYVLLDMGKVVFFKLRLCRKESIIWLNWCVCLML